MDATSDTRNETVASVTTERPRASDWLWRPWYAKLWWSAVPIWWAGMAMSTKIAPLADFYDGALAGFLNILFFPMIALMVLGLGYAQHWLAHFPPPADSGPLSEEQAAMVAQLDEEDLRSVEAFKARTNIYDPRSGGLFIGNPLSPQNPHHRI